MVMSQQPKEPYEELAKARRKVAKWNRKAEKAVVGSDYQAATIKLRYWEQQEEIWFERWAEE
jgi:hypothetical protein